MTFFFGMLCGVAAMAMLVLIVGVCLPISNVGLFSR
jgi:tetrahydromethanopterin S-methyltransferase subunit B